MHVGLKNVNPLNDKFDEYKHNIKCHSKIIIDTYYTN